MRSTYLMMGLALFVFTGCGTTRVYPPAGTAIESKSLTFSMPQGGFYAFAKRFKRLGKGEEKFYMVREYPGERYTIVIDNYTEGG